jgi:hypothetical protein
MLMITMLFDVVQALPDDARQFDTVVTPMALHGKVQRYAKDRLL